MAKPQKQHFCSDEGKECSLKKKKMSLISAVVPAYLRIFYNKVFIVFYFSKVFFLCIFLHILLCSLFLCRQRELSQTISRGRPSRSF